MLEEFARLAKLSALIDSIENFLNNNHLEDIPLEKELKDDLQYYSNTLYLKIEEIKKGIENG